MASVKKIALTIGIATGALLTIGAFATKGGKRTKQLIQQKLKKTENSEVDFQDHGNFYV